MFFVPNLDEWISKLNSLRFAEYHQRQIQPQNNNISLLVIRVVGNLTIFIYSTSLSTHWAA